MRMRGLLMAGLMTLAPALAAAQVTVINAEYVCERGVVVPVVYVDGTDPAMAFVAADGKLIALRQVPAASGAFYAAFDEQDGYRWRTRGDEAFLAWLAADHTAEEQVLLQGCTAR